MFELDAPHGKSRLPHMSYSRHANPSIHFSFIIAMHMFLSTRRVLQRTSQDDFYRISSLASSEPRVAP